LCTYIRLLQIFCNSLRFGVFIVVWGKYLIDIKWILLLEDIKKHKTNLKHSLNSPISHMLNLFIFVT